MPKLSPEQVEANMVPLLVEALLPETRCDIDPRDYGLR